MKRITLLTQAVLFLLVLTACGKKEDTPPPASDGSQSAIIQGSLAATTYPEGIDAGKVGDILTSLDSFVAQVTADDFTTAALLPGAYDQTVLRFNITDGMSDAVKITKADQLDELERDPLSAARQEVLYAAGSGHTVNNLTVSGKSDLAGLPDFESCFPAESWQVELTEAQTAEIVAYFAALLDGETDTELFLLTDTTMAFVMCERYSENSLLGFAGIFRTDSQGDYRLHTVIDFNC